MSHDAVWALTVLGIVVIVAVIAWASDRNHAKQLREHDEKMREIYRRHS